MTKKPPPGLLLGRVLPEHASYGFAMAKDRRRRPASLSLSTHTGDGHLLTIAPTGAGKGRGLILPNLLHTDRTAIVVDPKGEAYAVTAEARRKMGHRVIVLDPFGVTGAESDSLNPLDLLTQDGIDGETEAETLAYLMSEDHRFSSDPYWTDTANAFLSGLIAHVWSGQDPGARHLGAVRDLIYDDDVDYAIAVLLDKKLIRSPLARRQLAAYLQIPTDRTRPCVLSTARTTVHFMASDRIAKHVSTSTFDLADFADPAPQRPITLYLVLPQDKLDSHRPLLRLWVHTLLLAVSRRKVLPDQPTLFLIDEAAQLGTMPSLRAALTYLRGQGGLQVWTFWQDLSQLKRLYPEDWACFLANCAVISAFGIANPLMAEELSVVFGRPAAALLDVREDELIAYRSGSGFSQLARLDYLRDRVFAGRFQENPRFARRAVGMRPRALGEAR